MGVLKQKRRILITGASRGIGRATAIALASRGHSVILAARDEARLREVAAAVRGNVEIAPLDVTDEASVRSALDKLLARGPIDVLVNNAGGASQATFLEQSEAAQRAEMELNYFGVLRVTRALLPSFIAQKHGLIVNVSSILGSVGAPTLASYGASKAALENFSQALAGEVARFSIRVTVFIAPHTQTELGERISFRGVHSLPAEYVAQALIHAIDHAPPRYAASPIYRMLLRVAAWFPRFTQRRIAASVSHLHSAQ
jgi:short-subunit dehydrogenase